MENKISDYIVEEPGEESAIGVDLPFDFVMVEPSDNYQLDLNEFDSTDCSFLSRRVLLTGLPGSATASQVASGVAGIGGVVNIFVNRDIRENAAPGQLAAVVEFRFPVAAIDYVDQCETKGVWFVDLMGLQHQIRAQQILTPSNKITEVHPRDYGFVDTGLSGRCIGLLHFPVGAVWWLLKEFGVRHIVRVNFDEGTEDTGGVLNVEFTNIFESTRFCNHLARGYFPVYRPSRQMVFLGMSPCDRSLCEFESAFDMIVSHVDPDHIERAWNVSPYNEFIRPAQNFVYGNPIPRRPVAGSIVASPETTEGTPQMIRTESEVTIQDNNGTRSRLHQVPFSKVKATMKIEGTDFILIDDRIFARNREHSRTYIRVQDADLVELKDRYVLDDNWKPFWDQFSLTQGLDIRGYYAYAKIAAKRREENLRLHRYHGHSGDILKNTAVPEFIYSYSHPHLIRQVVDTTD
jgi:hypothetical protein